MKVYEAKKLADEFNDKYMDNEVTNIEIQEVLYHISDHAKNGKYELHMASDRNKALQIAEILQKDYGYVLDLRTPGWIIFKWGNY